MAARCVGASVAISARSSKAGFFSKTSSSLRISSSSRSADAAFPLYVLSKRRFQSATDSKLLCSAEESWRPAQSRWRPFNGSSLANQRIPGLFPLSQLGSGRLLDVRPQTACRMQTAANFSTSGVAFKEAVVESADTIIAPKVEGRDDFVVPEAPNVPTDDVGVGEMLLQGPTSDLAELGLNTWWPAGLLRSVFDYVHVTLDVPWWATIVIGTLVVRLALFPLVIKGQKSTAAMQRSMPEMQRLQARMSDARQRGDVMASAQAANDLQDFMKTEGVNPLKSLVPALIQAPVFMSFYFGLKKMADAPVESMKEGGLWWFTDLTVPDPYYLLPLMTSLTLAAVIEMGVDSGVSASQMQTMKYVFRLMPVFTFVFTSGIASGVPIIGLTPAFPAAVLVYWFTSNVASLGQVALLKIPLVRDRLGIPRTVKHDPALLAKKKTMRESFKESMQNGRIARELDERNRLDAVNFRQAGMGPVPKTFKYDPTKARNDLRKTTTSTLPSRKPDN